MASSTEIAVARWRAVRAPAFATGRDNVLNPIDFTEAEFPTVVVLDLGIIP